MTQNQQHDFDIACTQSAASKKDWVCLADLPPVMFGDTNSAGLRVSDNPYNNHCIMCWHHVLASERKYLLQ
jgi:hypothetical protein